MSSLDYITDESFRDSLLSDMKELENSIQAGNFKSAHVLAGSVVEAVLVEHLIVANIFDRTAALKLELADAIQKCREHGIISQRTADMSSVVRSYRNLIHPGRVIRLGEKVSRATASVARALVSIVTDEVAAVRTKDYGPTAEQILSKLEKDANVEPIIPHLLKSANKNELERLLIKVLPNKENELWLVGDEPPHLGTALTTCFRTALNLVDEDVTRRVVARFPSIIRSENDAVIDAYGNRFFRAPDMEFMAPDDKSLVKAHLFARMKRGVDGKVLTMLAGIGSHLQPEDTLKFIDPIARAVLRTKTLDVDAATEFLGREQTITTEKMDEALIKRLDVWTRDLTARKDDEGVRAVGRLVLALGDIPF